MTTSRVISVKFLDTHMASMPHLVSYSLEEKKHVLLYFSNNNLINKTSPLKSIKFYSTYNSEDLAYKDMPDPSINNPYAKESRQCILCKHNIKVDFKNPKLLSQFVSPYTGRIYDKHLTGLCDEQQKLVVKEIKRSRSFGFMAFTMKEAKYLKDNKLFNVARPQRPNPH